MSDKDVIDFKHLKIERGRRKHCTCKNKGMIIDTTNRQIRCRHCEAILDPYDAILIMAERLEEYNHTADMLQDRINNFKREYNKLVRSTGALRFIADQVEQNKKSLFKLHPTCPACKEPFRIEEIAKEWRSDALAEKQIRKRIRESKEKG
jgi:phage FluMu protein Com